MVPIAETETMQKDQCRQWDGKHLNNCLNYVYEEENTMLSLQQGRAMP